PNRVRNSSMMSRSGARRRPYAISVTLIRAMIVSLPFPPDAPATLPQIQLLEKVVALVIDDDKGGKILHFDSPDCLHAELGKLHGLDLLDAMLGEIGGRPSDRGEIKAPVLLAGFAHRG